MRFPGFRTIELPNGFPTGGLSIIATIIVNLVLLALIIIFILAFSYLVIGGLKWIASGGDKQALASARSAITYAVLGLVLALVSFAIINFVSCFFGIYLGLGGGCWSTAQITHGLTP